MPDDVLNPNALVERETADFTIRVFRYPGSLVMPRHAHDEGTISVVLGGGVVEEAHHTSMTAGAGWAVVKPAGTVHANRFGPGGATMLALVPRNEIEFTLPRRWNWVNRPAVFSAALHLASSKRNTDAVLNEDVITELLAALAEEPHGSADAGWLRRVKRTLDDVGQSPSSVAALAADADVHPVYLARRFRARYGVSIREYRKMLQVRRATELILGSRRSLSDIAHSCGFADHSHMCRSFRLVARINPGSLRFS